MNQQQGTIFSKVAMPIAITAIVVYLICSAWVGMLDALDWWAWSSS